MKKKNLNRRQFVGGLAAAAPLVAAFPQVVAAKTLGLGGAVAPSNRINLGFVGLGKHGRGVNLWNLAGFSDCHTRALCDVDRRQFPLALETMKEVGAEAVSKKNITQDWREVCNRSDVDAVVVSTPDHWHLPISMTAIRAGKDVICEKTSHTIKEGRDLVNTVDRYGAVFQMAMEDRALPEYRRMAEVVRNGDIGKLQRIEITIPTGTTSQIALREDPIPDYVDWQMWLGPAPEVPFQKERIMADYKDYIGWRTIRDYGGGLLTDWGVHLGDTALWAMDDWQGQSYSIVTNNQYLGEGLFDHAKVNDVLYRFESGIEISIKSGGPSLKFVGSKGWVGNTGWRKPVESSHQEILNKIYGANDLRLPVYVGEHRNFVNAVRSRGDTMYSAEYYHRISTWLICGNLAGELNRKLYWNPSLEAFENDDEANSLRSKPARNSWAR
ncbi:MAG: myo-inositol 2-dehydrogenase/D-chiro-inositol 1-dehydrogenase [Candidatus Pelagisphaera sp.]|jgi:myo-inositol 2-dehydrogenase/D-chiro-inositol 1-dehydrogenase